MSEESLNANNSLLYFSLLSEHVFFEEVVQLILGLKASYLFSMINSDDYLAASI